MSPGPREPKVASVAPVATIAATKASLAEKDAAKSKQANDAMTKVNLDEKAELGGQEGKASHVTVDATAVHWSERYPAKAKAVLWTFVHNSAKFYEATPNKTMKYVAVASAVLLFLGVLSLVLAQKDDAVQSKYGMAFPLDDSASNKAEKRVLFGIPGEANTTPSSDATTTPTETATDVPTTVKPDLEGLDSNKEQNENGQDVMSPAILIGGDEEEKNEDNDQRIVFIERLMGLHLSGPNGPGQEGEPQESQDPAKKVNAKWATRTRKFSIPLPSDAQPNQAIPEQQPHPMLRYAAAAMMSRLIAAAARAQMEAQAREALMGRGKDKDDDSEDESVPVLLATVRDEQALRSLERQSPPMYGRPMPRPMGPMRPQSMPSLQQRQMAAMAQRIIAAQAAQQQHAGPQSRASHPMMQQLQQLQALQVIQQLQQRARSQQGASDEPRTPGTQQALAMVVIPIQSQESRQAASHASPYASASAHGYGASPYAAQSAYAPRQAYYPSPYGPSPYSPYAGYRPMAMHPHPAASYAMPMHVSPMHMAASHGYPSHGYPAPAHYYRPMAYGHPHGYGPIPRPMHPAYSHMRPSVIEVPVEVPVPYHVPVPVAVRDNRLDGQQQSMASRAEQDAQAQASDQDHIVLLYDAEVADQDEGEDLQQSASEAVQEKMSHMKGHPFLAQPFPANPSFNKMKLWRELVGAKHAAQPGVRYMPIAMAQQEQSQESQQQQTGQQQFVSNIQQQLQQHMQQMQQQQFAASHQARPQAAQEGPAPQQPAFMIVQQEGAEAEQPAQQAPAQASATAPQEQQQQQ